MCRSTSQSVVSGLFFIAITLALLIFPTVWAQRSSAQTDLDDTSSLTPARTIAEENALPGTNEWQITRPETNHEIEGYASLTSVARGGQISLFVNSTDPSYTLEVFRMGWYGGLGARRVTAAVTLPGVIQPAPHVDAATGLIECAWTSPYVLTTIDTNDPSGWVSGVYLVKLTGKSSGLQSYIIFVVRDDTRSSELLFQASVTTYQAYNGWEEIHFTTLPPPFHSTAPMITMPFTIHGTVFRYRPARGNFCVTNMTWCGSWSVKVMT
jgi:hypothetical protein